MNFPFLHPPPTLDWPGLVSSNMTYDMSVSASGKIVDFRWTMVSMHYVMIICFNNCAYVIDVVDMYACFIEMDNK